MYVYNEMHIYPTSISVSKSSHVPTTHIHIFEIDKIHIF